MKFVKKPVVIDAFQMTRKCRWDNSDWPNWLNLAWQMEPKEEGSLHIDPDDPKGEKLCIGTLEGIQHVSFDDWIIQGVQGEIYPCKPDIFELIYDEVS